jgi:2-keto-4-pentenoate hydratase/2-oxohepta-3-ene-1,7-dioic acid hydratase in catechol pathway
MKFVRYLYQGEAHWGWHYEGKTGLLAGDIFGHHRRLEANLPNNEIQYLAPVLPSKIVCVGRNYRAHIEEHNAETPKMPLIFLKPPSSIIGNHDPIKLPPQSNVVEHEAELGVVIGRKGRWIEPEKAMDYVFGYTICNDVTARDLQRSDDQWTRAKGFDTFCPVGPYITTNFDASDALIICKVNDQVRQMASTRDMIFPLEQIIAFISSFMTLEPGDLILTGTPGGVGLLQPGDKVEIQIDGLGCLFNPVIN